jgi:hypothetical protein
MRKGDLRGDRHGNGDDEAVTLDMFWSMAGACGEAHPHLAGVVCVRDEGHPGRYPRVHRFWWKATEGAPMVAVEWRVGVGAAMVSSRLPSPRPAPGWERDRRAEGS